MFEFELTFYPSWSTHGLLALRHLLHIFNMTRDVAAISLIFIIITWSVTILLSIVLVVGTGVAVVVLCVALQVVVRTILMAVATVGSSLEF